VIRLDHGSAVPPFEQIRLQLDGLIRVGALPPGHRLPPVRQLAGDLSLGPGAVARAYLELEKAGVISTSRRGTVVRDGQATSVGVAHAAGDYATTSREAGLTEDEAVAALRALWRSSPLRPSAS